MVRCSKCKSENPPAQVTCHQCGADLLPGRSFAARVGLLALWILVGIVPGWAGYMLVREASEYICKGTGYFLIGFLVICSVVGIIQAVSRTPLHWRYAVRARKYIKTDPHQALADYALAADSAPLPAQRLQLLRARAALSEKLGMDEELIKDWEQIRLALTQALKSAPRYPRLGKSELASELFAILVKLSAHYQKIGLDDQVTRTSLDLTNLVEAYASELVSGKAKVFESQADMIKGFVEARGNKKQLLQQSTALRLSLLAGERIAAIGYCPDCRKIYHLDVRLSCPVSSQHRVVKQAFVMPDEIDKAEAALAQELGISLSKG